MNLRYLENKDIERKRWNTCVEQDSSGMIYALDWYLDVICENWDGIVVGDYESVFPVVWKKKVVKYACPPLFGQQLGLFGVAENSEELSSAIIDLLSSKIKYQELHWNYQNILSPEVDIVERSNYVLNFSSNEEEFAKNYSKNCKRNLKKASGMKLVDDNSKISDVIELFKNNKGLTIEGGYSEEDYQRLIELLTVCESKNALKTSLVYEGNDLLSGAIFVESQSRSIFLFSGANDRAKETGASFLLMDSHINSCIERGIKVLDFEGSNDVNVARFYKGFGATNQPYCYSKKNDLNAMLKMVKR